MPGRQSHGRSLLGNSQPKGPKRTNQKSKAKARAHALDAFAIAGKQVEPERMTRRGRDLELDPEKQPRGGKHRRDEDDDDDDEDDEEEDEGPRKKRPRQAAGDDDEESESDGEESDGGSDSEGHEWHVGINSDDDDSEIESDDAFGESDVEKFDGYAFGGGRAQKKKNNKKRTEEDSGSGEEDVGDDGESLGSDAIDLADALMQSSDDDEEEGSQGDTESGSEEDSESESDPDDEGSESEVSDDDEVDPAKRAQLDKLLKSYADTEDKDAEAGSGTRSKQGFSLQDLGISEVKNPDIKRSIKRVKKEERAEAGKKGTSKKLDVPLARRRQDQLDRVAAYEQTNKTLDRWNDTVKQNRRADHLMFPLPDTLADAGLDNSELLPLSKKTAGTELEQTIMSIMEESGLGPAAQAQKDQEKKIDANGEEQTISRSELKELWAQRRKDREMQSREQKRAKRIKKIKSKTYRRVHRKEKLGEEAKLHEEMKATGEIDSEDEREAAARRRALERVGAKHKDSKWAKMGSKAGRAAWDDDYRAGLTDMARRDEELRRRVEGRTGGSEGEDDSDATSSSGDEDGNSRLLKQLDGDDEDDDEDEGPHANLMKLKFMQRAEAARKQENDAILADIRRDLESGSEREDEDDADVQVGRRSYGVPEQKKRLLREAKPAAASTAKEKPFKGGLPSTNINTSPAKDANDESSATVGPGAWSQGKSAVVERKKKKITGNGPEADLDLDVTTLVSQPPKASKTKGKTAAKRAVEGHSSILTTGDDSSDDEIHHPLAVRDIDLANRAFAGDEVVAEFEAEKEAIMSEDDEKMVDNTMPGWGSWAGEGISKRALKRNKGKAMTKKEGIKRKDRKDAKMDRVIINEKRNRKNEKFLASQLPHPFESRQQYERSLRLPVGPEWMTKESFQASTKPRVIVKQGIIAPMAKPRV